MSQFITVTIQQDSITSSFRTNDLKDMAGRLPMLQIEAQTLMHVQSTLSGLVDLKNYNRAHKVGREEEQHRGETKMEGNSAFDQNLFYASMEFLNSKKNGNKLCSSLFCHATFSDPMSSCCAQCDNLVVILNYISQSTSPQFMFLMPFEIPDSRVIFFHCIQFKRRKK